MEENIGKALLIAAGVLIAVLILSLLAFGYEQISNYYNDQSDKTRIEQITEFNKEFQNYQRDDLRGTDVISLANKVIDYNVRQSYASGTGYDRIEMTVDMNNMNVIKDYFKYDQNDTSIFNEYKLSNTGAEGTNREQDNSLTAVISLEEKLKTDAVGVGIKNLTNTKLQTLAANIDKILVNENPTEDREILKKMNRAELLKKTFGKEYKEDDNSQLTTIKEIAKEYYQYMQFKRAHFRCTSMEFDEETTRICKIEIELKLENGKVVFN